MLKGYFITGTDTGVGKTLVSQILIRRLRQEYANVAGFKPVASGSWMTPTGLRNADALTLQQASSIELPYDTVNPYAFEPAIAPHLAAADTHMTIDLASITERIASIKADRIVVEGVGGWLVPLNAQESMADLARRLQLPVVLVVGLRLGCLNHALLTAAAIRQCGLPLVGWVANQVDPNFARCEDNIATLNARLGVPLLLSLPWLSQPDAIEQIVPLCLLPEASGVM
ncbi:MAG: dethiobiotin synthase [Gammaproteobacteria bacterium]|nr:dethiobiotin synthase [Gammaproteobacteria bacterium]